MTTGIAVRRKLFRTLLDAYLELADRLSVTEAVLSSYNPEFRKEVAELRATVSHKVAWMQEKTEDIMKAIEAGDYEAARSYLDGIIDLFRPPSV